MPRAATNGGQALLGLGPDFFGTEPEVRGKPEDALFLINLAPRNKENLIKLL
jgi:hypothetical protein